MSRGYVDADGHVMAAYAYYERRAKRQASR